MAMMSLMEADSIANEEVDAGERILWVGQPEPTRAYLSAFGIWLFAIPWTLFSVFWMFAAAFMGSSHGMDMGRIAFALFGLPFVAIGLGMLSAPYWAKRTAERTVYVVTDRRAMIIVAGGTRKITSYSPNQIGDIDRRERADGSGDLAFAKRSYRDNDGDRRTSTVSFTGIRDVRSVERMLRDLQAGTAKSLTP